MRSGCFLMALAGNICLYFIGIEARCFDGRFVGGNETLCAENKNSPFFIPNFNGIIKRIYLC